MSTLTIFEQASCLYYINELRKEFDEFLGYPISDLMFARFCAFLLGYDAEQISDMFDMKPGSVMVSRTRDIKPFLSSLVNNANPGMQGNVNVLLKKLGETAYKFVKLFVYPTSLQSLQPMDLGSGCQQFTRAVDIRQSILSNRGATSEDTKVLEVQAQQLLDQGNHRKAIDAYHEIYLLDRTTYGGLIRITNCFDKRGMTNDVLIMADFTIHRLKENKQSIPPDKYEVFMLRSLNLLAGHYQDTGNNLRCSKRMDFAVQIFADASQFAPHDLVASWNLVQCGVDQLGLLKGTSAYVDAEKQVWCAMQLFRGRLECQKYIMSVVEKGKILNDIQNEIEKCKKDEMLAYLVIELHDLKKCLSEKRPQCSK